MEAGQPARARTALLQAARADPTDAAARLNLALFYAETGELDLALQAAAKARGPEPSNPSSSLLEADLLIRQKKHRAARTILERLLAQDPALEPARELLRRIPATPR